MINQTSDSEIVDIQLAQIAQILWQRKVLITALTIISGLAFFAASFFFTPQYQSAALVYPVSGETERSGVGIGSVLSQYGGLAALGGLSFSGSNRRIEAIATIQSHALTEAFIQENNLLPVLFASKWDSQKGTWIDQDPKKIPTLWTGEEYFRKNVRRLDEDKKTGLVTLTITWKDAGVAADWANQLVNRTNLFLRQQAIDQSTRNISYLNDQIQRSSIVELQKSIYGLIEAEIKKSMIAQGSNEYAFKVIDPAQKSERKSSPNRKLFLASGIFLGFLAGSLISLAGFRRGSGRVR